MHWRKGFLIEHFLSLWDSSSIRFLDGSSFMAVRTASDGLSLPNRLYLESYGGIQKEEGYYLHRWQKEPVGEWIWEQSPKDRELYNMSLDKDHLQERNQLYRALSSPERQQIFYERDKLSSWLIRLRNCKGDDCRTAENVAGL